MRAEQAETIRVDGRDVKITRPEKVLFPEDGITKGDLIRYYQRIGPRMLPYLKGRPLALRAGKLSGGPLRQISRVPMPPAGPLA